MNNFTIGVKPMPNKTRPIIDTVLKRLIELSNESLYETIYGSIFGNFLMWDNYRSDMYQLCQTFPDVYFPVIIADVSSISVNTTNIHIFDSVKREVFINDMCSVDKPAIRYTPIIELEFEKIAERFKNPKTVYDNVIDFKPILKDLKQSNSSVDGALFHALSEWLTHFKDIDKDYFHKAFRQSDVLSSGHQDMIMWNLLDASKTFWVSLEKQEKS